MRDFVLVIAQPRANIICAVALLCCSLTYAQQQPGYNFKDSIKGKPSPENRPGSLASIGKLELGRPAVIPLQSDTERLLLERIALLERKIEILEARLAVAEGARK